MIDRRYIVCQWISRFLPGAAAWHQGHARCPGRVRSHDAIPIQEHQMADDLTTKGMKNEVEGGSKQAQGQIRNAAGAITGDSSEQIKGKAKDLEGKAQR